MLRVAIGSEREGVAKMVKTLGRRRTIPDLKPLAGFATVTECSGHQTSGIGIRSVISPATGWTRLPQSLLSTFR
jgi:hypothetical protein